ncbi:hypothetical protein A5320_02700 [Rheinheimera sp. SA_1]|uniref:AMP-binding protein n=1 Tax=Rheinheimera sp. SA_1 TaxID=1827365 RepID=UPI0007FE1E0D|nr:AMP-binding protein [Rheinheimera sp. SA_1]OBP16337.1 hypothetical protein A5320_02700 [Rheinheimera sp. SA_1]
MRENSVVSLCDLARLRAAETPDKSYVVFIKESAHDNTQLSFAELDEASQRFATVVRQEGLAGQNVLLLLSDNELFIRAFYGCSYGHAVPVPAAPPQKRPEQFERINSILQQGGIRHILTTAAVAEKLALFAPDFAAIAQAKIFDVQSFSQNQHNDWQRPDFRADDLAFLQFSSGSTGTPKGVQVTQQNLLHNSEVIKNAFGHHRETQGLGWLPAYHDMGLIGCILQPMYAGFTVALMSPTHFVKSPFRWLQEITARRVNTTGGPSFAYRLCLDRITPEQKAELDLSSWDLAFNGAEPVDHQTMQAFYDFFKDASFKQQAFYPCYGLAENTLMVSGGDKASAYKTLKVRQQSLKTSKAELAAADEPGRSLVSNGLARPGVRIEIVCPDQKRRCEAFEIGEIWVQGDSVGRGYINDPVLTTQNFSAECVDLPGFYMRTGDLGFCDEQGELYVTGRLKGLIIINGENYYPEDIERTAQNSHVALRDFRGATFAVDGANGEGLVLVNELERTQSRSSDHDQIFTAINNAIAQVHGVYPTQILLLKTGSLPVTTSGKVQREQAKTLFHSGQLDTIASWSAQVCFELTDIALEREADQVNPLDWSQNSAVPDGKHWSEAELTQWLTDKIAQLLRIPVLHINPHKPFASFAMNSTTAIAITAELQHLLQRELSPTVFYEYPTIGELAEHLAETTSEVV